MPQKQLLQNKYGIDVNDVVCIGAFVATGFLIGLDLWQGTFLFVCPRCSYRTYGTKNGRSHMRSFHKLGVQQYATFSCFCSMECDICNVVVMWYIDCC